MNAAFYSVRERGQPRGAATRPGCSGQVNDAFALDVVAGFGCVFNGLESDFLSAVVLGTGAPLTCNTIVAMER